MKKRKLNLSDGHKRYVLKWAGVLSKEDIAEHLDRTVAYLNSYCSKAGISLAQRN